MKRIYLSILTLIVIAGIIQACKKNELTVSPYDYTSGSALLKINYSSPYKNNPGIIVKINGVKVSGLLTYSTPFPGGGLNTGGSSFADYVSVRSGIDTVSISIPYRNTSLDSILLYKTTVDLKGDVYHTLHVTDTLANTQSVLLQDAANKPDSGKVEYKFVNLIPNSTTVDLYFGGTRVAANVPYKGTTEPFFLPPGTSLQWHLRGADGVTILKGSRYSNTGTVVNQRVFTIYARGYIGLDSTDIRSPRTSFAYNK